MGWLSLYQSEVERCNKFIAALDAYVAENGETEDMSALRKVWENERAVWEFGVNELLEEMKEVK